MSGDILIPSATLVNRSSGQNIAADVDIGREVIEKSTGSGGVTVWTADASAIRAPAILPSVTGSKTGVDDGDVSTQSYSSGLNTTSRDKLRDKPHEFEQRQEAKLFESLSARSLGSGQVLDLQTVKSLQIKTQSSIIEPSLHSIAEHEDEDDDDDRHQHGHHRKELLKSLK